MWLIAENFNSSTSSVHSALVAGDRGWFESRARRVVASGVHAIDVCASSVPGAEAELLAWMCEILEAVAELPLSLDSADAHVLAQAASRRRRPPWINSVALDELEGSALFGVAREAGSRLVIQLRRGRSLPRDLDQRLAWTEAALETVGEEDFPLHQVAIDPVLLPWGDDVEAAAGLLAYLARTGEEWPGLLTLVGLSNVSYGYAERERLHREWWSRLTNAGIGALILDALDPELMALARA